MPVTLLLANRADSPLRRQQVAHFTGGPCVHVQNVKLIPTTEWLFEESGVSHLGLIAWEADVFTRTLPDADGYLPHLLPRPTAPAALPFGGILLGTVNEMNETNVQMIEIRTMSLGSGLGFCFLKEICKR